jgi:hypothetical protein
MAEFPLLDLGNNGLYTVSGATFPAGIGSSGIVVTPDCPNKLQLVLATHAFGEVTQCDGNRFSINGISLADMQAMAIGDSQVAGAPFGSNTNFGENSYYYFIEDIDGDGRFRLNRGDIGWNLVWDQGVTVTRTVGNAGDSNGTWTITTTAAQQVAALLVPRGGMSQGFSVPLNVTVEIQ